MNFSYSIDINIVPAVQANANDEGMEARKEDQQRAENWRRALALKLEDENRRLRAAQVAALRNADACTEDAAAPAYACTEAEPVPLEACLPETGVPAVRGHSTQLPEPTGIVGMASAALHEQLAPPPQAQCHHAGVSRDPLMPEPTAAGCAPQDLCSGGSEEVTGGSGSPPLDSAACPAQAMPPAQPASREMSAGITAFLAAFNEESTPQRRKEAAGDPEHRRSAEETGKRRGAGSARIPDTREADGTVGALRLQDDLHEAAHPARAPSDARDMPLEQRLPGLSQHAREPAGADLPVGSHSRKMDTRTKAPTRLDRDTRRWAAHSDHTPDRPLPVEWVEAQRWQPAGTLPKATGAAPSMEIKAAGGARQAGQAAATLDQEPADVSRLTNVDGKTPALEFSRIVNRRRDDAYGNPDSPEVAKTRENSQVIDKIQAQLQQATLPLLQIEST